MKAVLALAVAGLASNAEVRLSESQMQSLLREAAERTLGPEYKLGAVHHRGELVVRGEKVSVEVDRPARIPKRGRVALRATLSTKEQKRLVAFAAEVSAVGSEPLVRRGTAVLIHARSGLVVVSATGQAQEDGAAGEHIHVLCPALRKVLVARVVDADTVAIDLGGK